MVPKVPVAYIMNSGQEGKGVSIPYLMGKWSPKGSTYIKGQEKADTP